MLEIFARDPEAPVPRQVVLALACDGGTLLCEARSFPCTWYPAAIGLAVRAGWTITPQRQLGPCCSGKRPV